MPERIARLRRLALGWAVAASVTVCVACGQSGSQASTRYPPIHGIPCETSERVVFHIHAHLAIDVDGQPQIVPYGIGIGQPWQIQQSSEGPFVSGGSCFYWLHTHTQDGVIHIESPEQRTFTLGDFFAIWGQSLSSTQVGSAQGEVIAYTNGQRSSGDPNQIPLEAHELIQLDVGADTPPQPFEFPPGL
jgi:hypothetical protein